MSEWINAKDTLPPSNTKVLGHYKWLGSETVIEEMYLLDPRDWPSLDKPEWRNIYGAYRGLVESQSVDYWMPINLPEGD